MEDGRKNNGGHRTAGRKSKSEEYKLIERLDNIISSDEAIGKLGDLVSKGHFKAIQLYMNYRFGKPKERLDVTTNDKDIINDFDYSKLSKETLIEIAKLTPDKSM